jgi:type III pantothenate kinase
MTTICLDFGNTRLKVAVFEGDRLQEVIVLEEDAVSHLNSILQTYQPERSILSSVIHHPPEMESMLHDHTRFHKLNHLSRLPFTIPVGKPETVGADRLALAAAAVHLFPRMNNLVIGLGTCITFNFINQLHEWLGGSISPGMEMRYKAMNYFTAKLPLVESDWNVPLIGYDTKTNLQSGVVLGMSGEIDSIIDRYAARYGNFNVLLTGGDIAYFEPHLKNKIFADPDLIFKGLYAISQINLAS